MKIKENIALQIYGKIKCPPEWNVKEKGTIYNRFYYIYGGDAIYETENKRISLKKDYIYFFPIHRSYHISHNNKNPLECMYFHMCHFPPVLDDLKEYYVNDDSSIFYLLKSLETVIDNQNNTNIILSIFKILFNLLDEELHFSYANDQRIENVLRHIHNNYYENIENGFLADLIHLNKHYFIRLFKENLGITPQKYLSNFRLNKAAYLLSEGKNVKNVARLVGFESEKAFSRAFKRNKGKPPSLYKENNFLQP